jgi:hypothetical protein
MRGCTGRGNPPFGTLTFDLGRKAGLRRKWRRRLRGSVQVSDSAGENRNLKRSGKFATQKDLYPKPSTDSHCGLAAAHYVV